MMERGDCYDNRISYPDRCHSNPCFKRSERQTRIRNRFGFFFLFPYAHDMHIFWDVLFLCENMDGLERERKKI